MGSRLDYLSIIWGRVGHARLWPKKNSFIYRVFYSKVLITKEMEYKTPFLFSFDRWNIFSMYLKDYGAKDKNISWYTFIISELEKANIPFKKEYAIYLVSHPRLFGFAFNPISYWIVVDAKDRLRAALCEVHNTFKQTHNYLLTKSDNSPITPDDVLLADKHLYVSPFNQMVGHYEFTFSYVNNYFKSLINYFDLSGRHTLVASVQGRVSKMTSLKILSSIFVYPAMTVMVVVRIHWQAVKLYFKKIGVTLSNRPKDYQNDLTTVSKKVK